MNLGWGLLEIILIMGKYCTMSQTWTSVFMALCREFYLLFCEWVLLSPCSLNCFTPSQMHCFEYIHHLTKLLWKSFFGTNLGSADLNWVGGGYLLKICCFY